MIYSKITDNSTEQYELKNILIDILKSDKYTEIAIATGYWDLPGMVEIYKELNNFFSRENIKFRLLLGEEPSVKAYQVKNPTNVDPDFPQKYLKKDLEELELKQEFQKVVKLLSDNISKSDNNSKLQIRVYKKNFLHAKCYIFGSEKENAIGIIGSSNFTKQGLSGNLELNALEDNNATVNYRRLSPEQYPSHRSWFEELWNESEDWSLKFKEEIIDISKQGSICFSPYEMYINSLYRIYGEELEDEKISYVLEEDAEGKPKLIKFQIQNANSLIKKLERQSVAMLSDSVGLGKTYTAIKVIEYYKKILNQRVVVICPAGIMEQWEKELAKFNIITEIYSLQNINKVEKTRENLGSIPIGLFVFDESHNLRSMGGQRFETFTNWKISCPKSKTLLLTATPINNQLTDLTNQIILGTGGEVKKIGEFYDRAKHRYFTLKERFDLIQKDIKTQIKKNNGIVDFESIKEQLTPLLNKIIVRRARQGIENEYPDGIEINGKLQKFPQSIPDNLEYKVQKQFKDDLLKLALNYKLLTKAYKYTIDSLADNEYLAHPLSLLDKLEIRDIPVNSSLEIIYTGILALGFPCYRYNIYKIAYYNTKRGELKLDAESNRELSRQIGIYGIFRTIFLKRLESSLFAIKTSLNTYEKKLEKFQKYLEGKNKIISVKNLKKLNDFLTKYNEQSAEEDELDIDFEELEKEDSEFEMIEADKGIYHVDILKDDIKKDLDIISVLRNQLDLLIKKDNKIQKLADTLNNHEDKKVLIFSYFTDTVKYLREKLPKQLRKGQDIEFALGNRTVIENMAKRFAPISKDYKLKPDEKEIQYLVATDKLSEGQNLQDCGIIINYDLHWNPVRMIQRNGRINRLGTLFKTIYIYNFRPQEELESYLRLVKKLEAKINLIRYTIGSDQSVLDEEPIPQQFTEDLYSKDEKARLKAFNKIFETSEFLAVDNLFLDDLRDFDSNKDITDNYKELIKNLPKGKWGKITIQDDEKKFDKLVHIIAENNVAGYFAGFKSEYSSGELLNTSEGLLRIRATKEDNKRYKDIFQNKIEFEKTVSNFINEVYIAPEQHTNTYNKNQIFAMEILFQKMEEYGYPVELIEKTAKCINHTQNAFTKKQILDNLSKLSKRINKNIAIDNNLIDDFIKLSKDFIEEITEPPQLKEFIYIFSK